MAEQKHWVRDKLGDIDMPDGQAEEISEELAAYLEDRAEQFRSEGLTASDARATAEIEVGNWRKLGRNISRSVRGEEHMKDRMRQLWLPGATISILAFFSERLIYELVGRGAVIKLEPVVYQLYHVNWLVVLIALGAGASFWSLKAGGSRWTRWAAATFPAALFVIMFAVTFLFSFIVDTHVDLMLKLRSMAALLGIWVVLPGTALTIGALPFVLSDKWGTRPAARGEGGPPPAPVDA